MKAWEFSGSPEVRTLSFHCRGRGFSPWLGCVLSCFSHVGLSATPWTVACCPRDSLGKNTGVGCCALLQGIFPTQGLNLCLVSYVSCMSRWFCFFFLPLVPPGSVAKKIKIMKA